MCEKGDCLLKKVYAILNSKGGVAVDPATRQALVYRTRAAAMEASLEDDGETVKKVCICAA